MRDGSFSRHKAVNHQGPVSNPRRLLPACLVIAVGSVFLLGTSRPLDGKDLSGIVTSSPDSLVVVGPPTALFGENVNNQGCCRSETVDLAVAVVVRNDGPSAIQIREAQCSAMVDGASFLMADLSHGEHLEPESFEVALGQTETIELSFYSILPRASLYSADEIQVVIPIGTEELHVLFEGVSSAPVIYDSDHATSWLDRR